MGLEVFGDNEVFDGIFGFAEFVFGVAGGQDCETQEKRREQEDCFIHGCARCELLFFVQFCPHIVDQQFLRAAGVPDVQIDTVKCFFRQFDINVEVLLVAAVQEAMHADGVAFHIFGTILEHDAELRHAPVFPFFQGAFEVGAQTKPGGGSGFKRDAGNLGVFFSGTDELAGSAVELFSCLEQGSIGIKIVEKYFFDLLAVSSVYVSGVVQFDCFFRCYLS